MGNGLGLPLVTFDQLTQVRGSFWQLPRIAPETDWFVRSRHICLYRLPPGLAEIIAESKQLTGWAKHMDFLFGV